MNRVLLGLLAMLLIAPLARGQSADFPSRPLRVIVPFPPGSGADSVARFAGRQLEDVLGQPFVVDNRVGANGAIALAAVKNDPSDGYTLFLGSSGTLAINPIVVSNLPYDAVKDFKPIHGLTRTHVLYIVPAGSRIQSVADLVSTAKANRGKLNVGTFTSSYVLTMEWFSAVADVKFTNIPYKSVGQVLVDLLGGQLDFTIIDITGATPLLQSGKVRAIATLSNSRPANFPDVPTFVESGYPSYVNYLWNGFFVRTEVPNEPTTRLANAMQRVLGSSATAEYMKKNGVEALPLGPAAMRKYHLDDLELLRRVANAAGIKPE